MNANVAIQVLPQNYGTKEEVVRIMDEVIAYIMSTGLKLPSSLSSFFKALKISVSYSSCRCSNLGVARWF